MRGGAIARIIIFSLLAVVLSLTLIVTLLGGAIMKGIDFNWTRLNLFPTWFTIDGNDSDFNAGSGSVSSEGLKSIDVNWVSGSILIQPIDGDEIVISEPEQSSSDYQLRWKLDGGMLKVNFCKAGRVAADVLTTKKNLVIGIPTSCIEILDEVTIGNVSANISVISISPDKLTIESVSGGIELSNINSAELDIDSVSGKVKVSGSIKEIDIQSVSGEIELELIEAPRQMELETTTGNITLDMPDNAAFTIDVDTVSGDVECVLSMHKTDGKYLINGGGSEYDIETVSGDITIH